MNIVGFCNTDEDFELIVLGFTLEAIAKRSPAAVLDLFYDGINPKEEELVVCKFISTCELCLKGCSICTVQNGLNFDARVVDGFIAVFSTLVSREEHLLIEILEICNRVDDSTRGNGTNSQMRILITIPSRDCTWI